MIHRDETGQPAAFYHPDRYRPDDSVGYLMRRIMQEVSQEVERQLVPADLTNAQWFPLFKLHRGDASTVADLARHCQLDAGAMTRLLDRLEAKGLLRRERSLQDRRVVNLFLTDEGRAAAQAISPVLCGVQNACLAGFTEAEWTTLTGLLRRVLANAQTLNSPGDDVVA